MIKKKKKKVALSKHFLVDPGLTGHLKKKIKNTHMITDMLFSLTHWELAPKYVLSILDQSRFKLAPSLSERVHITLTLETDWEESHQAPPPKTLKQALTGG